MILTSVFRSFLPYPEGLLRKKSMAEGTIILVSLVWAGMDPEVVYAIRILIKNVSGDNCELDTEQLLA